MSTARNKAKKKPPLRTQKTASKGVLQLHCSRNGLKMAVKINNFEIENVKRVKAVSMELAQNGLTVIGRWKSLNPYSAFIVPEIGEKENGIYKLRLNSIS